MQKHQDAFDKTRTTLLEMGYPPEIIQLAFKEATSPNIDHLLDLLKNRGATYEYIVQRVDQSKSSKRTHNRKKDSCPKDEDVKNEGEHKKSDDSSSVEERGPLPKFENKFPKVEQQLIEPPKEQNLDKKSDNQSPQQMDEIANKYVDSILSMARLRARDPNWLIIELSDQLKPLKFRTSEGAVRTRNYLEMPGHFPKLVELKKSIYSMIRRILATTKVKKRVRVNTDELGQGLILASELGLIKRRQMQIIQTEYSRFCNKIMVKPDEEVLARLDQLYREAPKDRADDDDDDMNLAGDANEDIRVEGINDAENQDEEEEEQQLGKPETDKEFCILCMEKVREVVFMPCCHFMACTLCSPKVTTCPVCKEVVQKYLRLYWS